MEQVSNIHSHRIKGSEDEKLRPNLLCPTNCELKIVLKAALHVQTAARGAQALAHRIHLDTSPGQGPVIDFGIRIGDA
jgi:hypothetical protein